MQQEELDRRLQEAGKHTGTGRRWKLLTIICSGNLARGGPLSGPIWPDSCQKKWEKDQAGSGSRTKEMHQVIVNTMPHMQKPGWQMKIVLTEK